MTIYELIYKANENDSNVPAPTGLYSSLENAKTAGNGFIKISPVKKNFIGQKNLALMYVLMEKMVPHHA